MDALVKVTDGGIERLSGTVLGPPAKVGLAKVAR
jgi:hypothetical protein